MIRPIRWVLGGALAVAAVEMGFRASGEALPSLRGGVSPFVPSERPGVVALADDVPGCIEEDSNGPPPTAWGMRVGTGPGATLLFAGDSVTLGQGVSPSDTYAVQLGTSYAEAYGVTAEIVNAGVNAAGYCGVFRAVHHHHAHERFDRTVIALFADDLEQRAVVLEGEHVRANPAQIEGWVARLATASHAFNWVWHIALSAAVKDVVASGDPLPPHVRLPGRTVPETTLHNLERAIRAAARFEPIYLLVPPAGLRLCPERPAPNSECEWMVADMHRMAAALDSTNAAWVDLRNVPTEGHVLAVERAWWRRDGRLPVHPNASGHRAFADAAVQSIIGR